MRARVYYRVSAVVASVVALVNVVLAIFVFRASRDPVQHNIRIIQPPHIPVYTNGFASVGAAPGFPSPSPGSSASSPGIPASRLSPDPSCVGSYSYQYFVDGHRVGVWLNGRYCYVGDRTAFGVVSDIYPERIYLTDGNYIQQLAAITYTPTPQQRTNNNVGYYAAVDPAPAGD